MICLISGRKCKKELHQLADHIDKVAFDTGIARTTGGGVGVASGACVIGGAIAAPFTAGLSIGLSLGGAAGAAASAATSGTATFIQSGHLETDRNKVKAQIDEMRAWDKIVQEEMKKLTVRYNAIQYFLFGKFKLVINCLL